LDKEEAVAASCRLERTSETLAAQFFFHQFLCSATSLGINSTEEVFFKVSADNTYVENWRKFDPICGVGLWQLKARAQALASFHERFAGTEASAKPLLFWSAMAENNDVHNSYALCLLPTVFVQSEFDKTSHFHTFFNWSSIGSNILSIRFIATEWLSDSFVPGERHLVRVLRELSVA
jgi:hypothetical protein